MMPEKMDNCVLLVEDNFEALEIYTRVFQFIGFEVRTALNARAALGGSTLNALTSSLRTTNFQIKRAQNYASRSRPILRQRIFQ